METFNPQMKALLIQRLEKRIQQGRLAAVWQIAGRRLTPEQMLDEARRGTPIGEEILMAEKGLMDYLKSKLPR